MSSTSQPHDLSTFPAALKGRCILLCVESFGPINGVSRTNLNLVNHLRSHGALVSVVAPDNHTKVNTFKAIDNLDASSLRSQEVRLAGYPVPFNPELSIVYPVRLRKLYERTFGGPPDLIYLGSPASLGCASSPEAAQVPVLCNFQTDLAGYCEILFPRPLGAVASWTFSKVQGYLFQHASVKTLFYPSTFVRKYLEGAAGVPGRKLEVLRRGVNNEGFKPSKRSEALLKAWAPNGEIILFTCARLAGEKGFGFLADAAIELDRRGLDFKLVVVGGNRNIVVEQEVKDYFRPLADKDKVVFTGFKVGEELMEAYASAHLFLHCSITETFGLVVLEAMASGVPVVARDEGGPSDIIEHGTTGYLVPPADLDGFVEKVFRLSTDHNLRERFSQAARDHACEATWEKINNKVAWKMADAIEAREREQADYQLAAANRMKAAAPLLYAWLLVSTALRRLVAARVVDVRLGWGLLVIVGFWAGVSVYLAFIKVAHFVKDRAPRVYSTVDSVLRRIG
ncbi:glycosyltransferase family 4 protein [Apiospora phragmitis]|uniref:Glycosyltransferase family 4 protein n=1 Tax=Apiospora phragmitis TaxID=2905665 RepID=A0ABR1TAZ0_9PEZI